MDPVASRRLAEAHHNLPAHEVILLLQSDLHRGLTSREASSRLARFGPNELPAAAGGRVLRRLLRQFHHPLIYVLLVAGAITIALGEYVDAAVIFAVVVLNAAIGFGQESKAEAALDTLRSLVRTRARVRRDGQEQRIASQEIVPGDVVLLEAGDMVPADLRLIRQTELHVDESALTGESVPVAKDEVVLPETTHVADRRNMAYSGTLVTSGSGVGVAVATGPRTEIGQIHRLVGAADSLATPLTQKLGHFSRLLTVAILALALFTFAIGVVRGEEPVGMFTAAIALAVAAIPEGLPAAVTITLAIGVARMASRRAVIRRLPAVETLGSTTVICSDKTGTLTKNEMTVQAIWTPTALVELTGTGYAPEGELRSTDGAPVTVDSDHALRWSLIAGVGCNDAALSTRDGRWRVIGDPTEGAMLVAGAKAGFHAQRVAEEFPRIDTIPFTSKRRYMATLHHDRARGGRVVLLKGAVERVLQLCDRVMLTDGTTAPTDHDALLAAADELASQGLRVLATAVLLEAKVSTLRAGLPDGLVLTGLQAMLDPPRSAAAAAVRACHTAGIDVKMITGDHVGTAVATARRVGILGEGDEDRVLTGADLATLPDDRFSATVERARVFARVSPEQKLRLVEALQERGHVVAVTGDGVNDAPALHQADVGVAMGKTGTEVAKDAADMVLTDDDFATIEAAVEEGRGVFDNLTKFVVWTLPTNMGQGLLILVAILWGTALPVLPTQILWINMTTAVALGLMLAFEPKEAGIMQRPPRDPHQPLLTGWLLARIGLVSTLIVAGAWWIYEWELASGASLPEARSAAVNLVILVQAFYLLTCRSLTRPVWQLGWFSNGWIIGGIAVQALAQVVFTYVPAMNLVFDTAVIGAVTWLRIAGIAVLAALVVVADKWLRSRWRGRTRPGRDQSPATEDPMAAAKRC